MSKKIYIAMITIIIIGVFIFIVTLPQEVENITVSKEENKVGENTVQTIEEDSQEKIEIQDIDGKGRNYIFTYKDEEYKATYTLLKLTNTKSSYPSMESILFKPINS